MAQQPNALAVSQIADVITTTLRDLGKPRFVELATPFTKLTAMRNLLHRNRVQFESGTGFNWDAMIADSGSAANVGLAAPDNVDIDDFMATAVADWRYSTANYGLIGQVVSMNREPARIVDYVKTRRIGTLISLAVLMENNFWGPPVAVNDLLTPWGVNTWIVKSATEGFNGLAPAGYTVIGLNPTLYPNWANWTYQYVTVSIDDLIRHWRKAATRTDFAPPVDGIPTFNTGDDYEFFTNYAVYGLLEEILTSQNDNLGTDLASMDGKPMFRRAPVYYIPRLDSDTTNPIYGLNWGWFKTFVLQDWWLKETHIPNYPGSHTVAANFLDLAYNFVARNRRPMFVLALGTTTPG